jgi:DNA-binding transcriptional regulator PaaX
MAKTAKITDRNLLLLADLVTISRKNDADKCTRNELIMLLAMQIIDASGRVVNSYNIANLLRKIFKPLINKKYLFGALRSMKQKGFIDQSRQGNINVYTITPAGLGELASFKLRSNRAAESILSH